MAIYYVRKSGNDSNDGLSPAQAWLTIDKAANEVAAGDTVHIGAGVYRELVTMDTGGSSGNPITYIGDITGEQTGDPGIVLLSAFDNDAEGAVRAGCWNMNGKEWIVVRDLQFVGTNSSYVVGNTTNASHIAYEGCKFEGCIFTLAGRIASVSTISIEINNGATPTDDGLQFAQCIFCGEVNVDWDSNGSAMINLKWLFSECLFVGYGTSSADGINMARVVSGGANTIGGIKIQDSTFVGVDAAFNMTGFANTTNVTEINNCLLLFCDNVVVGATLTSGAISARGNISVGTTAAYLSGVTQVPPLLDNACVLIAGIHDLALYRKYGWSPFLPWTPMDLPGYTNPALGQGQNQLTDRTIDLYGAPRLMGPNNKTAHIYYFDASDDAISDPNSVWSSEENIVDTSLTTNAFSSTTGSTASNYAGAGGTNAPSSGPSIFNVYARVSAWFSSGSGTVSVTILSDGSAEELGVVSSTATAQAWTDWVLLDPPSGGWTWEKIQALEFKSYRSAGTGTARLAMIQASVEVNESAMDVGAVEARTRPQRDTSWSHSGDASAGFSGAGYYETFVPVDAVETTISVWSRYDSNYSGDLPILEVFNIPGVADQSDAMTEPADTEEQLSVVFTPSAAGIARVRLRSRDNSLGGKCFFDDLAVS